MEIPGLGPVEADDETYISYPVTVPVLDYNEVEFFVEGYDDDDTPEDFHDAIEAFLALDESALRAASEAVYAYYEDVRAAVEADGARRLKQEQEQELEQEQEQQQEQDHSFPDDDPTPIVEIAGPDDVWNHVELGVEATVARDTWGDQEVCVSVTCPCDWEREHALQIVFRGGREISKVGPYNGHMSNAAAYDRADLAGVVYKRRGA